MSKKTIIIGHKNPDTDSICSALAYAELKKLQGEQNVLAGRAGNVNPQTAFVLSTFDQSPPSFFSDLYPRLSDIMVANPVTVHHTTPVLSAMKLCNEQKIRFLPVVDEKNKVSGSLSPIDLTKRFGLQVNPETARKVITSPDHIANTLDAALLSSLSKKKAAEYQVFVGAMSEESFKKKISKYDPSSLIIIVGDRIKILKEAITNKVAVVIVSGGHTVSDDLIKLSKQKKVTLMVTPYDSASTAWLVKLSTPAGYFVSQEISIRSPQEKVESVKKDFIKSHLRGIMVADEQQILQGVITKSNFLNTSAVRLILVDHNELSQAVDGATSAEIVEVIDHHRLVGFQTAMPIPFVIEPIGSTCTLIAEKYESARMPISKKTAGLLLAGIISDTITGRSPTTTKRDLDAIKILEKISQVKSETFSREMFEASSIVGQKSPEEVLLNDFKEFEIGGKKIGIGQVEVVGFNNFNRAKNDLREAINRYRKENRFNMIGLMVTDITYATTLFLVDAEKEINNSITLPPYEKNLYEMKGVLSRKKQVIPYLYTILTSACNFL